MKNRTLAESAGICGVRFLNSMSENQNRLPDFAKKAISACSKAIAGDIPWDAWRERVKGDAGVDTSVLLALGFRPWNDEGTKELWLFPFWLVPFVPEGFPVVAIDGERLTWKRDEIDDDTRFGCIAYGIEVPKPTKRRGQ